MHDNKQDESRWKRRITIFATILLVSSGLCGANVMLVLRFVPFAGPDPQPGQPEPPTWPGQLLSLTGRLELIGIVIGFVGLLVSLLASDKE